MIPAKLDRIVKWGLVVGVILGVFAWVVYTVEHNSKHEHDWRLRSEPSFQKDFPPGTARRGK